MANYGYFYNKYIELHHKLCHIPNNNIITELNLGWVCPVYDFKLA